MKIKEGFILRKVGSDNVVVATGKAAVILNGIIKLNETGVLLWDKLVNGADEEELAAVLVSKYGIGEDIAERDVKSYLEKLRNARCIEE